MSRISFHNNPAVRCKARPAELMATLRACSSISMMMPRELPLQHTCHMITTASLLHLPTTTGTGTQLYMRGYHACRCHLFSSLMLYPVLESIASFVLVPWPLAHDTGFGAAILACGNWSICTVRMNLSGLAIRCYAPTELCNGAKECSGG